MSNPFPEGTFILDHPPYFWRVMELIMPSSGVRWMIDCWRWNGKRGAEAADPLFGGPPVFCCAFARERGVAVQFVLRHTVGGDRVGIGLHSYAHGRTYEPGDRLYDGETPCLEDWVGLDYTVLPF